jgi:hypothetical protein
MFAGSVENQYFVGASSPSGHSISNHSSGRLAKANQRKSMSGTVVESRSSAARTRRHRQRRRKGTRCVTVEISETEVAALVASGYLAQEERADGVAIKKAIETAISDIAFDLEYGLAATSRLR